MTTHTVCTVGELPVGQHRLFTAGGNKLIVYHLDDGFFATQASCTHVFAPLAKGKIVDGCRTSEAKRWGDGTWPPGIVNVLNAVRGEKDLQTYPVRVNGNQVQVDVA